MGNIFYDQAVESAKQHGLRFYVEPCNIRDGDTYADDVLFVPTLMDAVDAAISLIDPERTGPLVSEQYDVAYLVIEQSTRPEDPECEDFADVLTVTLTANDEHLGGHIDASLGCPEDVDFSIGGWWGILPTHRNILYSAS